VKKTVKKSDSKKSTKAKKSQGTSVKSLADGLKNIWPVEREFMERPDRWKYVRKIAQPEGCVFCEAHKATTKNVSFESLVLHKSKHSMVVMNKYPYNTGHILIIPQQHCGDLAQLSLEVHLDAQTLLKEAVRILQTVYGCAGLNAGINLGAVSGAGIPEHLHWHLIPRWFGDTNFFPLIAETKVLPETLEQTYKKLLPLFKDLK
jgi:ATP adenylyltransferase